MNLFPDDYKDQPNGRQGQSFRRWSSIGFNTLPVLSFLYGKPWDHVALGYVHSLRPSVLRVVINGITLDCILWRVTVWLKQDAKTIDRIEQEVEIGLPEQCPHAAALAIALKYGMDSNEYKKQQQLFP